jgi:hypothetical protein
MLCPSCNNFRPANNSLCPHCQAPSPLVGSAPGGNSAASGNPNWNPQSGQVPFPSTFWQGPANGSEQQMPFPQAPQTGNLWMQVMSPLDGQPAAQQSLVPYQEPQQQSPNSLMVLPNAFPTIHTGGAQGANPLLPALPTGEEQPVYIAPHYTKPRPIIPRYRAISGLISMLIVGALLCGGVGYYAQATGKLVFLQKMFGNYTPPKISIQQNMLKVPSMQGTPGPVWGKVITSAAISDAVDHTTNQVTNEVNQFIVHQTIYITCSANTTAAGTIILKLYTNNNLYATLSKPVAAKTQGNAYFSDTYNEPAEGRAEIYWADAQGNNAQLAITLLFVVEPQS